MRNAGDAGEVLAFLPDRRLACRTDRGKRCDIDIGAGIFGAGRGILDDEIEDRFQPIMARVMDEIGLGGGKDDALDAAADER